MQKKPRHFAFNLLLQKILLFVAALAFLASPVATLAANPTTPTGTTTTTQQQSTTPTTQQNLYTTPVNTQNTSQNTTQSANQATSTTQTTQKKQDVSQTCEAAAGPLSFFLCPAYTQITKGINWMAGPDDSMLTNLLRVQPLQFSKDTGLLRAYQNILVFANSLFVIVFLVIIFASLIRDFSFLDNYNLKSNLPRLIAAVILAQFGYLICSAAIDLGNIAGTLIPKTISAGVLGPNVPMPNLSDGIVSLLAFGDANSVGTGTATVTNLIFGGGSGIVFILLFLLAIVAFFALLMALIYMVARVLILYMLVLAAPIAFLAFVLPGTQPFFFRWGRNLVRLVIMFPLVVGVVTIAEIVSFLLQHPTLDPNTFTDDRFKLLIGGLIPFVALFMIPKCLKSSGDLLDTAAGAVAGYVVGKSRDKDVHNAAWRDKAAESKFGKENRFGRAIAGGGISALVDPHSGKVSRKLGESRSRAAAPYEKVGITGTDDEVKAMLNSRNTVERQAGIKALAKRGNRQALQDAFNAGKIKPIDMAALKTTDFKEFAGMPDLREYKLGADGSYTFDEAKFFSGLNASSVIEAGPSTQKEWFLENTINAEGKPDYGGFSASKIRRVDAGQLENILRNPKVQGKMNETVRKEFASYASTHGAGDAHGAAILSAMNSNGVWN